MEYHDPKHDRTVVLDYKAFLLGLRKTELEVAYIILNDNDSPKLFEFWMEIVNDAIKEADRISHTINKPALLELIEKSIIKHDEKQICFSKEFLPARTPEERKAFEEIVEKYKLFMFEIRRIKQKAADHYDSNVEVIRKFAKEHFEVSLQRKTGLLEYTHSYISLTLSKHIYRIRVSLEECLLRVKSNLKKMEEDRDLILNKSMVELYEKNQERLAICRKENRSSGEEADIEYTIHKLRDKIEDYQKTTPIPRLGNEVRYWENRIQEFRKIESVLQKLKHEKAKIEELEKQYKSKENDDLVSSNIHCCENMGKMIQQRKTMIEEKLTDAARALLTFFGVRGQNRVLYTDNIGKYFLDEYGHQIYYFDFGKKVCHLDCKGNYRQINEDDKYYYDRNGRYVLADDGEKNYQIAPCTSTYNLSHEDLLVKTTVDCGHSEKIRPNCRMQLKDPNLRKNVPSLEPLNIKETLLPEVAQYLWENVAHALPESLRHVGELHPRNPIHELAHSIVFNRYRKTKKETTKLEQEAKTCRERIMRCRDEKEIAQSEAWKRKQTQPCKPADTDNDSVYDAHVKRSEFIRTLISFDD